MLAPIRERYPLADRLELYITSYSVHLIVAFITLTALIWHISSVHIHDDYGMPDDWIETFDHTHFTGGRGFLWGLLFTVVAIDCVHALLALDHYHARRYERGCEDGSDTSTLGRQKDRTSLSTRAHTSSSSSNARPTIPLPTHAPQTHHPLLTPILPPSLCLPLTTLYDTLVAAVLVVHTFNFFHVIDTNWDACDSYVSPYPENFLDPMNTSMSVLARCRRICTDSYVSGGFDIALCVVLLACHVWGLGLRVWEWGVFGVEREREGMGCVYGSVDGEGQRTGAWSTAVRSSEWIAEGGRKRAASGVWEGSEARRERSHSVESAKWSEVLLECLVP